jgi:hypothetical protein
MSPKCRRLGLGWEPGTAVHGYEDNEELRSWLKDNLNDEMPPDISSGSSLQI